MASEAFELWLSERADRLDELEETHREVEGRGAGRRWRTERLNWSLLIHLAAEFQGFCRDLHDLSAEKFAGLASGTNKPLGNVLLTVLTQGRQLDRGNAQSSSLGSDFGRLGMRFWPEMEAVDSRSSNRKDILDKLVEARNAIAHARLGELESLRAEGFPPTLKTVHKARSALNGLASSMDRVLAEHLAVLFDEDLPW